MNSVSRLPVGSGEGVKQNTMKICDDLRYIRNKHDSCMI